MLIKKRLLPIFVYSQKYLQEKLTKASVSCDFVSIKNAFKHTIFHF